MFKIISSLIWLVVITVPLIWFFNNNGWIEILWLGYDIKIDILTFLLGFILVVGLLFIMYRLFWMLISLSLGFFGIFKPNELKKRNKEIKKYEETIDLIIDYIKAININDDKEAGSKQKQIHSLIKNNALKEVLLEQIGITSETKKENDRIRTSKNKKTHNPITLLKKYLNKKE